jgi:adenylyl-sulfate kinase
MSTTYGSSATTTLILEQAHLIQPQDRVRPGEAPACTLWFTGLPGAGKTTLAMALEARLFREGRSAYTLDGDNLRHGLCRGLGFSDDDRTENIRRAAEACRLFNEAGVIALCALVSPLARQRAMARDIVGPSRFLEVHVATPLEVCESRDPKGLYRRARQGGLKGLTGVDGVYELPAEPALRLDTSACSLDEALSAIENLLAAQSVPR